MRKKIASVAIAAALAGSAGGAILTQPLTAFAADTSTAETAQATARTPGQWVTDSLKGLVDKGTITQAQSDEVAKTLEANRPQGGPGRGGHGGGGPMASAKAAEVLGISEADLKTALQTKSLADVAKDKNVDVQKVIDALVTEENTRIDQQVTDGKLTQDQANTRKADTVKRVTDRVNNVRPAGDKGGRGHGPDDAPVAAPAA